jgi:uncharacterized protein YwlG (UPF0340 family)
MSREMNQIAKTIVDQLGGMGLLRLLLGTRQVLFNDQGIRFDIHGCKKINCIKIEYNAGTDLYDVKFLRNNPSAYQLGLHAVAEYDEIYADQLRELIESETGLFLGPIRIQMVGQYARL